MHLDHINKLVVLAERVKRVSLRFLATRWTLDDDRKLWDVLGSYYVCSSVNDQTFIRP